MNKNLNKVIEINERIKLLEREVDFLRCIIPNRKSVSKKVIPFFYKMKFGLTQSNGWAYNSEVLIIRQKDIINLIKVRADEIRKLEQELKQYLKEDEE